MTEHHSIVSLKHLLEKALFHELFKHSEVETTVNDDVTTYAVTTSPVSTIPRREAIRRARHTAAALGLPNRLQLLIKDDDESLEVALLQVEGQMAMAGQPTEPRESKPISEITGDCSAAIPPRPVRAGTKLSALLAMLPTETSEGESVSGLTARQLHSRLQEEVPDLVIEADGISAAISDLRDRDYIIESGAGQGSSGYRRQKWREGEP